MRALRALPALLAAAALALCGCYSFSQTVLPSHLKTVSIAPAKNLTYQAAMGDKLTQGIQEMFRKEAPSLRQVNSQGQAEFEITLKSYTNTPHSYNSSGTVDEYSVTIVVDVEFRDNVKEETIYKGTGLRGSGIYSMSKGESEELHGQTRALEEIQQLIVNNALSGW